MTGSNIIFVFQASSLDYTWELFYSLYFPGKKKKQPSACIEWNIAPRFVLGNTVPAGPPLRFWNAAQSTLPLLVWERDPWVYAGKGIMDRKILQAWTAEALSWRSPDVEGRHTENRKFISFSRCPVYGISEDGYLPQERGIFCSSYRKWD